MEDREAVEVQFGICSRGPSDMPARTIRLAAFGRYVEDQADLMMPPLRPAKPWDVRVAWRTARRIGRPARWLARRYERGRSFVVAHLGFVSAETRAMRGWHCGGCSQAKDRGDGVLFCAERQRRCGCGTWLGACLWWLLKLWRFECPLGYFGTGNDVALRTFHHHEGRGERGVIELS